MPSIDVLGTGIACRNPVPHLLSRHAYFPSLVQLDDGTLVCTMDIGSAFEAVDVRSYACRSTDGGQTWSRPRLIFAPDESEHPVSTTCRVGRAADGTLVGAAFFFDRSRPDQGLANSDTDGFVAVDLALVRSADGETWSEPQPLSPPLNWRGFEACSPILALDGQRCLLPTALWPDWEGRSPHGQPAIAFLSDDGGRTWDRWVTVMDGSLGDAPGNASGQGLTSWEQKQVRLSDGRLLAVCWAYDRTLKASVHNRYAFSNDLGESYGPALEAPIHGETCTPLALADNHLLCIYRRVDQKGLWAHLARIEGAEWVPLADQPLWGTAVAGRRTEGGGILSQLSTLRFGYPTVIQLQDGQILAAFWGVEDCVSHIRWFRLGVGLS